MIVLAKVNEDGLPVLILISGGSLLLVIALAVFGFIRSRKGGRREARSIADPLQLQPGTATRSLQINLQSSLAEADALAILVRKLKEDQADLERQEGSVVVLFTGSRRAARSSGFEEARDLPVRILADVVPQPYGSRLSVRLDDDFGPLPFSARKNLFCDRYQIAFERLVSMLKKAFEPHISEVPPPPEPRSVENLRPAPAVGARGGNGSESEATVGTPLGEFGISGTRRVGMFVGGIGGSVFWFVLAYAMTDLSFWERFNPTVIALYSFLLVVLTTSGALILRAITLPRLRVVVGSNGISLSEGGATESCLWSEIKIVREIRPLGYGKEYVKALASGENRMYVLECFDGKKLKFRSFISEQLRLAKHIHESTLPYMLPPVQQALAAGERIRFGPITVSADDITGASGHPLPWEKFAKFGRGEGRLLVKQTDSRHDWLAVPIGDVPNLHVLFAVSRAGGRG